MKPKKRFALCKNGVLIDSGSSEELAEKQGTARALIPNYARAGQAYKVKYTFLNIGLVNAGTATKLKWYKDWTR